MNLYTKALIFAATAHQDQERKYTGAPYITHPIAVAEIVRSVHGTAAMQAAALLHDTVEDCSVPIEMVKYEFGDQIAIMVEALTDPPSGDNRATRKQASLMRLAAANAGVQTIKLADLIDNTSSIVKHDPKFAVTYLAEKQALVDALVRGNADLRLRARRMITEGLRTLEARGIT